MPEVGYLYGGERLYEHIAHWTRFYSGMSEVLYKPGRLSGADAVDAEWYRLVADALRQVLTGVKDVQLSADWFLVEWKAFQASNNAKVDAAPNIKTGPMAGQSSIHYRWASDCRGEQGHSTILRVCRGRV